MEVPLTLYVTSVLVLSVTTLLSLSVVPFVFWRLYANEKRLGAMEQQLKALDDTLAEALTPRPPQ